MIVVINAPGTKTCLSEVVYVIVLVLHPCDNRDPCAFNVRCDPLVLFFCFVCPLGRVQH